MSMRRRRRPGPAGSSAPDPALPLLTQDEAAELRTLVRETLSEQGHEPVMHPDHATLDDGTVLGLDTLARACLADPRGRRGWPRTVRSHFERLLGDKEDAGPDGGTLVVRLADLSSTDTGEVTFAYAPEPVPGLHEVLCLDRPETVVSLGDQVVEERAVPLHALLDEGRENLGALLRRTDARAERATHEGLSVHIATGDDVYTASYALLMGDAMRRWVPGADLSDGVLFAVPFRHQLAFAVCTDREAVLGGLRLLPLIAGSGYAEGVGPLSPHVYLWRDGEVTQVSRYTDGGIEVRPGPHLEAILGRG